MKRAIKSFVARWIARRIEARNREMRRALRDHQRATMARIHRADHRALGLKLYAAWSAPKEPALERHPALILESFPGTPSLPDFRGPQLIDYNA